MNWWYICKIFYRLIFSPGEIVQYKLLFSNWDLAGYDSAGLKRHTEEDTLRKSWSLSFTFFFIEQVFTPPQVWQQAQEVNLLDGTPYILNSHFTFWARYV